MKSVLKAAGICGIVLFLLCCPALSARAETNGEILSTAWQRFNEGRLSDAAKWFLRLQQAPDTEVRQNARMGLGYTRLKQRDTQAARAIFSRLARDGYQLLKTLPALLETYPEGDSQRAKIARRILTLDPDHEFALVVSAWDHYHHQNYAAAEAQFARLSTLFPGDEGANVGLGYSMLQQKKVKGALFLVESLGSQPSEPLVALRQNVYDKAIVNALDQNRLPEAGQLLDRWAHIDCDRSADRIARLGNQVLDAYSREEGRSHAWHMAGDMGRSDRPCLQRAAAVFYDRNQAPVTASQFFDDQDSCFANADAARIDTSVYYRHRSGDPGLSRLNEIAFPVSVTMTFPFGHQLTVSHVYTHLDSSEPAAVRAGSYYLYENGSSPAAYLDNRSDFHQLWLKYKKEGPYPFEAAIGTSPIGGDSGTTPLFNINTEVSGFEIDIHRSPVDESILSYAGLDDPYGENSWGRVTRTGGKLGHTIAPGRNLWISGRIGLDLYRGENVTHNTAWLADLALGQTRMLDKKWEFSYGVYGSYQHFERNSNFFTFGHGGYYSPNYMVSAGPLLRLKSRPCHNFHLDFQASAGWMWEQTDDAPFYPGQAPETALSQAGRNEFNGTYQGNSDQGPTALVQISAWKLLTPRLALGGEARVNLTSEYNEWQLGFNFKYFFKKQNAFRGL